jgi:hypothetical protein
MATASSIQSRVNYGYGKVASILGAPYSWYRPAAPGAVVQPANLLGSVLAYVTASRSLNPGPSGVGKPDRYAAFDPTNFLAGDYLVGPETYFLGEAMPITGLSHLLLCNETFTLSRRGEQAPGEDYVGGGLQSNAVVAVAFPGWIKSGDRRQASNLHLPGEVEMPTVNILLPVSIPAQVLRGDELTTSDVTASRWVVQAADLTPMGWSLIAVESGAASPSNTTAF